MDIYKLSLKFFKKPIKKYYYVFKPLEKKLKIAKIKVPLESYSAAILGSGVGVFLISFFFLMAIGFLIFGFSLAVLFTFLMLSIFIGVITSSFVYLYPNFVISERGSKIDNSLAFVSIYLSTVSSSGLPPQNLFKLLSRFKEYGAVSQEAKKINNDIDGLGLDLPASLDRAIKRSPSEGWSELLSGLKNSITVGGSVDKYLKAKAEGFVQDYKRKLDEFSKLLTILMNLYITIIIVGTVFFIVVSSLMATVGGFSVSFIKALHYGIIFIGLPLITIAFIMMIKSASPWAE